MIPETVCASEGGTPTPQTTHHSKQWHSHSEQNRSKQNRSNNSKIQKKNLIAGRFIYQSDIDESKKIAVISDDVFKQLFDAEEEAIGDFIKINEISYKVVGVFEQGDFDFGGQLHIPFTTFQKV